MRRVDMTSYVLAHPRIVHHALLHDGIDGKLAFVQHLVNRVLN
jgi:hypothetical protein